MRVLSYQLWAEDPCANGKILSVEGDPEHPVNKGYLCLKAKGIKPLVESEQRLKFPLKKTKAGWTRFSWDEAFDFAADRLTKIREKNGAESLVRFSGAPVTYEARDGFRQFMGVYGSPNNTGALIYATFRGSWPSFMPLAEDLSRIMRMPT